MITIYIYYFFMYVSSYEMPRIFLDTHEINAMVTIFDYFFFMHVC